MRQHVASALWFQQQPFRAAMAMCHGRVLLSRARQLAYHL